MSRALWVLPIMPHTVESQIRSPTLSLLSCRAHYQTILTTSNIQDILITKWSVKHSFQCHPAISSRSCLNLHCILSSAPIPVLAPAFFVQIDLEISFLRWSRCAGLDSRRSFRPVKDVISQNDAHLSADHQSIIRNWHQCKEKSDQWSVTSR